MADRGLAAPGDSRGLAEETRVCAAGARNRGREAGDLRAQRGLHFPCRCRRQAESNATGLSGPACEIESRLLGGRGRSKAPLPRLGSEAAVRGRVTVLSPATVDTFLVHGIQRTRHLTTSPRRSQYERATRTPISSDRRDRRSVVRLSATEKQIGQRTPPTDQTFGGRDKRDRLSLLFPRRRAGGLRLPEFPEKRSLGTETSRK